VRQSLYIEFAAASLFGPLLPFVEQFALLTSALALDVERSMLSV
jgi:hypothetical protein